MDAAIASGYRLQPHQQVHENFGRSCVARLGGLLAKVRDRALHVLSQQGAQVHRVVPIDLLEGRLAAKLKHGRQVLSVFGHVERHAQRLGIFQFRRKAQDRRQVRAVHVIARAFEQPVAAGDQLPHARGLGRGAFRGGNGLAQGFAQLLVQGADQQAQARLSAFVFAVGTEPGDGPADTVVLQDQFEALSAGSRLRGRRSPRCGRDSRLRSPSRWPRPPVPARRSL